MSNTRNKYSFEVKKQVVEMFFEGYSVDEIVEKHGLSSRKRIYDWVAKVREYGYSSLGDQRGLHSKGKKKTKKQERLEEENERLKMEVAYLKKLIALKRG